MLVQDERFMSVVPDPVEPDHVVADERGIRIVALEDEGDLQVGAVVDHLEGVQAEVLPALLRNLPGLVAVVRITDG
jgi:hypothetical protein